jgi:glutaconate CoA-transferase subunit A
VPGYGIDLDHLNTYVAGAKDPASWEEYRRRFVEVSDRDYVAAVGGTERIHALPAPVF